MIRLEEGLLLLHLGKILFFTALANDFKLDDTALLYDNKRDFEFDHLFVTVSLSPDSILILGENIPNFNFPKPFILIIK